MLIDSNTLILYFESIEKRIEFKILTLHIKFIKYFSNTEKIFIHQICGLSGQERCSSSTQGCR